MPPIIPLQSQTTRLPLTKFSHTTTTINHSAPLSWTHVNSDGDLTCILEQVPGEFSVPPRLVLRVARNDGILEQLDLAHFARMSTNHSHNENILQTKPAFAVVVKSPCLAVKYPQSSMHIRRFQIKFSRIPDYFTALALLSDINCPLTEGSTSMLQPRKLPSSSSWASFQAPTFASKDASTSITSDNDGTIPFFPMPGYIPSGITSKYVPLENPKISALTLATSLAPNPPSSASSPVYNVVGQAGSFNQFPFESTAAWPPNQRAPPKDQPPEQPKSRPATSPAFHGDQLDQMLPPKRDLPFLKSSQKRPRKEDVNLSLDSPLSSISKPPVDTSIDEQSCIQAAHDTFSAPNGSQVSDSKSQFHSQPLVPSQLLPDTLQMDHLFPQSQTSQPEAHTSLGRVEYQGNCELESGNVAPMEVGHPVGVVGRRSGIAQPKATNVSEDQLLAYLRAPEPERITFLENWMCELIEDDTFMALCQDIEMTWQRFAFGVRK
ncbi:hypothetical protein N7466_007824 [Penicillium verhagenii]|uniref:uncharacterized protein n=1 Tax=Penicillium verhagenii TaxID=1562060 RepID=UPI0025451CBF|nr:uncharacterized protein N7466_007824 [Penicillium verhagenii]KAJ5928868.1 hypothetical protein N7466_007824 [Penicillium verhagenii]